MLGAIVTDMMCFRHWQCVTIATLRPDVPEITVKSPVCVAIPLSDCEVEYEIVRDGCNLLLMAII